MTSIIEEKKTETILVEKVPHSLLMPSRSELSLQHHSGFSTKFIDTASQEMPRNITTQDLHEAPMMRNYNKGTAVFKNRSKIDSPGSRLLLKYEEGLIQNSIEK